MSRSAWTYFIATGQVAVFLARHAESTVSTFSIGGAVSANTRGTAYARFTMTTLIATFVFGMVNAMDAIATLTATCKATGAWRKFIWNLCFILTSDLPGLRSAPSNYSVRGSLIWSRIYLIDQKESPWTPIHCTYTEYLFDLMRHKSNKDRDSLNHFKLNYRWSQSRVQLRHSLRTRKSNFFDPWELSKYRIILPLMKLKSCLSQASPNPHLSISSPATISQPGSDGVL